VVVVAVSAIETQQWVKPRRQFSIQSGCALDNPYGIPAEEIYEMLLTQPTEVVAQTVFGRYVPSSGLVFTSRLILNLFKGQPMATGHEYVDAVILDAYRNSISHYGANPQRFKLGADLARKTDSTTIYVLDTLPLTRGGKARVVYHRSITRVPWEVIYSAIGRASWLFHAEALIDSTGAGDVVLGELQSRSYCPVHHRTNLHYARCRDQNDEPLNDCDASMYHRIDVHGYEFSTRSKVQLLTHLAQSLGHDFDEHDYHKPFGLVECPQIPKLRVQLSGYQWDDKKLETDEVMGLALGAWLGVRGTPGEAWVGNVYGEEN
jgi:hypothetical protein